jgi:hypothetical protein
MAANESYTSEQIRRTNAARDNYERNSTAENLRKLDEEYNRMQRGIKNRRASGAGRGQSKASDYKRKARRD